MNISPSAVLLCITVCILCVYRVYIVCISCVYCVYIVCILCVVLCDNRKYVINRSNKYYRNRDNDFSVSR